MNTKARSDSLLSQLTDEQQAQVYDWLITLGYTKTLEKLAQPSPQGFDLKTHRNSLQRFFRRYQNESSAEDLAAAKENRPLSTEDASALVSDAEQAYLQAAHQRATGPLNSEDFDKVGRWLECRKEEHFKRIYVRLAEHNAIVAQKRTVVAEQRLELDRDKFRFNAARQALIHFAELALIAQTRDKDNEDKIRAAADLLFQPAPKPDRGRNEGLTSPLPPNRTGGFPASGFPVSGLIAEIGSLSLGPRLRRLARVPRSRH